MQTDKGISLPEKSDSHHRYRWRRAVALALLPWYALIGWLRLSTALRYWAYLLELNIWPRPLYFAVTGGLLGASFTLAWIFLLFKSRISGLFNRVLSGTFLIWFWTDRILFSTHVAFFNQLAIALFITAATLAWIFLLSRKTDFQRKERPPNGQ